ncbi:methanogenesis marker protein 11 [Methanosarcina mazei]|uniref:Methanogenesis marker protein 11 n=1 Tax=Methanosarcina mazei TaxID=2209 RepID=A0A0F8GFU0_METMZ|nr:methanogenesis marker protein 11 [Methanosarcina mazei]KKG12659.1 methanogenesis marker protein 11 [Methanosarcina mazei]KKG34271.1 methanogenesis marker protein 11 [Methanosarcina mazei]KKG42138.1 methanogenesis marker protein 11 [Methanosarcina mazei]KKG42288.1 methanogenesis marker protein 11 [Methanosarcina mazei]KKG48568.1 methanogenesis marker protein 11 [Methanosarcina mazei]
MGFRQTIILPLSIPFKKEVFGITKHINACALDNRQTEEVNLDDPYTVPYRGIYAVCDAKNEYAEIIEHSNCYSGAAWSLYHYAKSPLILKARSTGNMIRYFMKTGTSNLELKPSVAAAGIESVIVQGDEVEITYAGLGGGGVGATRCRAFADGVLHYRISESGGERCAKGTVAVPRRDRILIGIDDTDSKDVGATWTLTHNIARQLDCQESVYLSHSLVQLFPVPEKTQNCMSTVLEFGCVDDKAKSKLLSSFKKALEKYSASKETGLVVLSDFYAKGLYSYSNRCRTERVLKEDSLRCAEENNVEVLLDGNGVIGALASLPWFGRPEESIIPGTEIKPMCMEKTS